MTYPKSFQALREKAHVQYEDQSSFKEREPRERVLSAKQKVVTTTEDVNKKKKKKEQKKKWASNIEATLTSEGIDEEESERGDGEEMPLEENEASNRKISLSDDSGLVESDRSVIGQPVFE